MRVLILLAFCAPGARCLPPSFCSEPAFKATSRNVSVFFHIAEYGEWERVASSLVRRYLTSPSNLRDIADLRVGFLGSPSGREAMNALTQQILPEELWKHVCFVHNRTVITEYEFPTLRTLAEHCEDKPDGDRVLYLHTKGEKVSVDHKIHDPEGKNIENALFNANVWRLLGEHFVMDQFSECVKYRADICGPLFKHQEYNAHFQGNFWSATCAYIRGLPKQSIYNPGDRYYAEFWIGLNSAKARVLNCYSKHHGFYYDASHIAIDFESATCAENLDFPPS